MSSTTNGTLQALNNNLLEKRMRECKNYLVKNLKVLDLVLNPGLQDVVLKTEAIMRLERIDEITYAAEMFLNDILQSPNPLKWDKLKAALGDPQHVLIADILERGETAELKEHDQLQKRLEKFRLDIMRTIDPMVTSQHLQQCGLLSSTEVEKVLACQKQDSDTRANYLILLYVPRNKGWFRLFLETLWKLGHHKLVKRIDANIHREFDGSVGINRGQTSQGIDSVSQIIDSDSCTDLKIIAEDSPVMQNPDVDSDYNRTRSQAATAQYQMGIQEHERTQRTQTTVKTPEPIIRTSSNENHRHPHQSAMGFTSKKYQHVPHDAVSNEGISRSPYLPVACTQKFKFCPRNLMSNNELEFHQMDQYKSSPRSLNTCDVSSGSQTATKSSKVDDSSFQKDKTCTNYIKESNYSNIVHFQMKNKCDLCGKLLKNEIGVKIHKTKIHLQKGIQSQENSETSVHNYGFVKNNYINIVAGYLKQLSDKQITAVPVTTSASFSGRETKDKGNKVIKRRSLQTISLSDEELDFTCSVCGRSFATERGMKCHKMKMHQ